MPKEVRKKPPEALLQVNRNFVTVLQNVNTGWQSLTADYLSHLPASTLPLSLHHFLKYSAESIKKEAQNPLTVKKTKTPENKTFDSYVLSFLDN